jgi:predicted nucleic acid-binding protein
VTPPRGLVVADTTPLITLAGVGEIRLLPLLFGEIHIPEQVWDEYEKFRPQQQLPDLSAMAWLQRHLVISDQQFTMLDDGEAAALTLVQMLHAQLLLVDEQKARKVAAQANMQIVGTLGLLLRAKQEGHLAAIRPITDQFLRLKRYYTPVLIAQVLQAAGE